MFEFVISKKIQVLIVADSISRAIWIFREEFKYHDLPKRIIALASLEPYEIAKVYKYKDGKYVSRG